MKSYFYQRHEFCHCFYFLYYFKSPISVYDYVRDNDHELQYVPDHYNHYNHSDPDPNL